jgi:hypothetical protein
VVAANTVQYIQFTMPFNMTVRTLDMHTFGLANTKAVAMGLYDSTCTLIPGAQNNFVGAGTGNTPLTFALSTPANLTWGTSYYLGMASEDSGISIATASSGTLNGDLNDGSDKRMVTGATAPTGTGATYTLPSSCGVLTGTGQAPFYGVLLP